MRLAPNLVSVVQTRHPVLGDSPAASLAGYLLGSPPGALGP